MPFNPTDELSIAFTVAEWNQIMGQLQEGPWKIVHPLITKIQIQAAQQEEVAKQPPRPPSNGYTNGEAQPDVAVTGDSVGTIVLAKDE